MPTHDWMHDRDTPGRWMVYDGNEPDEMGAFARGIRTEADAKLLVEALKAHDERASMPETFTLTTLIAGHEVTVRCDERSARILLRTWQDKEPNHTSCRGSRHNDLIVCFIPDRSTSWGKWCSRYDHIADGADLSRPRWPGATLHDRIVQGLMDEEGFTEKDARPVADWFIYGIEPLEREDGGR